MSCRHSQRSTPALQKNCWVARVFTCTDCEAAVAKGHAPQRTTTAKKRLNGQAAFIQVSLLSSATGDRRLTECWLQDKRAKRTCTTCSSGIAAFPTQGAWGSAAHLIEERSTEIPAQR